MNTAITLACDLGIEVCDCYGMWKEMNKTQDTTKLLINRINHPTQEMHQLFADALFRTIFKKIDTSENNTTQTTMYEGDMN